MSVRWLVIAAAVMALEVGAVSPQGTDADLAAGIRQVDEGDFEAALVPLGRAVRTLSGDASRSKELARAHLYLGIAYVMLDQEKAGRASFREALTLDRDLRLSPEEFPRKVLRAFTGAAQDAEGEELAEPGPAAPPEAGATASPSASEPRAGMPDWLQEASEPSYEVEDDGLRMAAYFVAEPAPGRALVTVAADVDSRTLASFEKDGRRAGVVWFHLGVVNRETNLAWYYSQTLDTRLQGSTRAQGWLPFFRDFELPSGAYQAILVVRAGNRSSVRSARCSFEVPSLSTFRVSSPVLSDTLGPRREPVLLAHRALAAGKTLYVQFEVFGAARDRNLGLPRVAHGLTVRRSDGREVTRFTPTRLAPTAEGRLKVLTALVLDLVPGEYALELSLKDEVSGLGKEIRATFAVVDAPSSRGR